MLGEPSVEGAVIIVSLQIEEARDDRDLVRARNDPGGNAGAAHLQQVEDGRFAPEVEPGDACGDEEKQHPCFFL